ncbi:MAG: hypothetical protein LBH25_14200 [Fibromonadaceae bacterium]|jgi:hypothetical protein|nr:hypothetical protein [Fibromonadaceae bacterium]
MAINLPGVGGSPISADLMYRFYDNKAITPQILTALQKKQDAASSGSDSSDKPKEKEADSKPTEANKPGPATKVNISEQIIRMSMASKTSKLEDLKSTVKPSEAVLAIEKKLADQKKAEEEAKKAQEETTPKADE